MSDEKPLANLAATERDLKPALTVLPDNTMKTDAPVVEAAPEEVHDPVVGPVAGPAPSASAREQLRKFEDDIFGADVPRISGNIERGVGSKYQRMTDPQRRRHAALERLVKAEDEIARTTAELEKAELEHDAAIKAASAAANEVEDARAE